VYKLCESGVAGWGVSAAKVSAKKAGEGPAMSPVGAVASVSARGVDPGYMHATPLVRQRRHLDCDLSHRTLASEQAIHALRRAEGRILAVPGVDIVRGTIMFKGLAGMVLWMVQMGNATFGEFGDGDFRLCLHQLRELRIIG